MTARVAALLAMVSLASVASAEPLPADWTSYSQTVTVTYPADYGDLFRIDLINGGASEGGGPNFRRDYNQVFQTHFGRVPWMPDAPDRRYDFTATVTLTDKPSGESKVFTFAGYGLATTTDYDWGTYTDYDLVFPESWERAYGERNWVRLGDSMYSVEAIHAGIVRTSSHPVGWVDVPEPGTIALGGLGVAAIGGWWVKRRRK
jgi:hypothetical protein